MDTKTEFGALKPYELEMACVWLRDELKNDKAKHDAIISNLETELNKLKNEKDKVKQYKASVDMIVKQLSAVITRGCGTKKGHQIYLEAVKIQHQDGTLRCSKCSQHMGGMTLHEEAVFKNELKVMEKERDMVRKKLRLTKREKQIDK